jgi:hypothetical protein
MLNVQLDSAIFVPLLACRLRPPGAWSLEPVSRRYTLPSRKAPLRFPRSLKPYRRNDERRNRHGGFTLRQPDELLAAPDDYVLGNTLNDRI